MDQNSFSGQNNLNLDLGMRIDFDTSTLEQGIGQAVSLLNRLAAATDKAAKSQAQLDKELSDKTAAENAKLMTKTVSTGMETLSSLTGGATDAIGNIIVMLFSLREAMLAGASAGACLLYTSRDRTVRAVTPVLSLFGGTDHWEAAL